MASAAVPAAGSPGGGSAAGTPGRCRAGAGPAVRARTRRPAAAAAPATAGERPAAATRSPGTENASMTRRAACGGDRAAAGLAVADVVGGQAGPDAQRHAGTCPAGRAAPGRRGARGGDGRLAVPGWVEGLCHGGWSRVPPLSALTLHKSGFRGLFSPARQRNIRAARITRENSPEKFFRALRAQPRPFTTCLVPGVYLECTCDIPRRSGAGQRPNVPGRRRQAGAAAGAGRAGRGAGAGTCQVDRRYTAGTSGPAAGRGEVHRRYTPGRSRMAGWGFVPVRLAHLELAHG